MEKENTCPICNEGHLTEKFVMNEVEHLGITGEIKLFFEVCDSCGIEQGCSSIMQKNKIEMLRFKAKAERINVQIERIEKV